jgi:integrase
MASIRKREGKNGVSYRVDVRLKGFPSQRATFKRLTDARKWAQHTESAIRERRYFKTAEARKHTLTELIERYKKDILPNKSENISQAHQLKWWADEIGEYTLADVTPSLISECRDKLLKTTTRRASKMAPATVTRYMAALSHAFTMAVNEWEWLEDSPMRKVSKPSLPRGRIRFLDDDERDHLLKSCRESNNEYLYTVVVLALSTGMRKSEIMGLTWKDVDLKGKRITLLETKNDEIRVLPITGHALELLRKHVRRIDSELLFPSKMNSAKPIDLRTPWETALKNAGIEDFRFHDLRHSAASYLAMNGASLAEIAEVLGHKTLQMVRRYAHLSEAHTTNVVASMNEKIFGAENGS